MKIVKTVFTILIYTFALIGIFFVAGYLAVRFGFFNVGGVIENDRFIKTTTSFGPAESGEWQTFKASVANDRAVLQEVEEKTGIRARLIVGILAAEQLRLYNDERELYKRIFAPLKILGNMNQFSWGIMGIKEATAKQIEKNLKDDSSDYYLGARYEAMLDFQTEAAGEERFERIIDEKNHYWSYLYAALYLKQYAAQWAKAGHPIDERPEILATLYNIGFEHSRPNPDPKAGGAAFEIGSRQYSFGSFVHEFYYSDELTDMFPG